MFEEKPFDVPAPGNYAIKSMAFNEKERSRFAMGNKLNESKTMQTPGPGAHNPEPIMVKKRSANYSMGLKLKSEFENSPLVPGPGNYDGAARDMKRSSPKFGFGTSKRPEMGASKNQTPGPGNYKVPAKIGNVADFMMPGRTAQSKYV